MAYDKSKIEKKAIKLAKENHLITDFTALASHLEPTLKTLYNWKFHELQDLKDAFESNRVLTKLKLREKWFNSTNATLNIALYKLLATEEERRILSDSEITVSFKDLPTNIDELSDEEVEKLYTEYTNGSKKKDS